MEYDKITYSVKSCQTEHGLYLLSLIHISEPTRP